MWYSSSSYQILPNCDGPTPHNSDEKSSVKEESVERVLVFEAVFEFRLVQRLLLFESFASRLLLLLLLMLASAMIRMTTPIPIKTSTAPIPRIQGHTLRFGGTIGGIGDHAGGGVGGGGAWPAP